VCATKQDRNPWAAVQFSGLLNPETLETTADLEICIEGVLGSHLAHKMVIAARCSYLRGFIRQASQHRAVEEKDRSSRLVVELPMHPRLNHASLKSLLLFMYTGVVDRSIMLPPSILFISPLIFRSCKCETT